MEPQRLQVVSDRGCSTYTSDSEVIESESTARSVWVVVPTLCASVPWPPSDEIKA